MSAPGTAIANIQRPSLATSFANKYELQPKDVFGLLRDTALKPQKDGTQASDAEVAAFMIVCNQYELNPFIKEIYGFISKGKMQYVISVDGWATLVNRQSQLNGIEFEEHFHDPSKDGKGNATIKAITCRIHRKDRALPTVITEYMSECRRDTDTWKQWPIRMLRHKAMIQCSRIAFGLAGIMDEDEAERMDDYPRVVEATESRIQPTVDVAKAAEPVETAAVVQKNVTVDQAKEFYAAYKKSGKTPDEAKAWLKETFQIEDSRLIPADQFDRAMAWANTPKGEVLKPWTGQLYPAEDENQEAEPPRAEEKF